MAKINAPWVKPGVAVRDVRHGSRGVVVAIFGGSPWVAWDYVQPAPGLHRAWRCRWEHLRPALTLVPNKEG